MPEPAIDFTRLSFPSDTLTVGSLRKVFPHSFDLPATSGPSDLPYGRETLEYTLGGIIDTEREVASLAFKQALGVLLPTDYESRDEPEVLREVLVGDLIRAGVATGQHHAEQLVRDLEGQAVAQARSHLGKPR